MNQNQCPKSDPIKIIFPLMDRVVVCNPCKVLLYNTYDSESIEQSSVFLSARRLSRSLSTYTVLCPVCLDKHSSRQSRITQPLLFLVLLSCSLFKQSSMFARHSYCVSLYTQWHQQPHLCHHLCYGDWCTPTY